MMTRNKLFIVLAIFIIMNYFIAISTINVIADELYVDKCNNIAWEINSVNNQNNHDCIVQLLRNGIITGYEDGTIRPNNLITREEIIIVIIRAMQYKSDINISTFLEENKLCNDEILSSDKVLLLDKSIVENNITREKFFSMICKLLSFHNEKEYLLEGSKNYNAIINNSNKQYSINSININQVAIIISNYINNEINVLINAYTDKYNDLCLQYNSLCKANSICEINEKSYYNINYHKYDIEVLIQEYIEKIKPILQPIEIVQLREAIVNNTKNNVNTINKLFLDIEMKKIEIEKCSMSNLHSNVLKF